MLLIVYFVFTSKNKLSFLETKVAQMGPQEPFQKEVLLAILNTMMSLVKV
jgi:hypothetical protein